MTGKNVGGNKRKGEKENQSERKRKEIKNTR
jgi:hypothetical protein